MENVLAGGATGKAGGDTARRACLHLPFRSRRRGGSPYLSVSCMTPRWRVAARLKGGRPARRSCPAGISARPRIRRRLFRLPDRESDRGADDDAAATERPRRQCGNHGELRAGNRAHQFDLRDPPGFAGAIFCARAFNGWQWISNLRLSRPARPICRSPARRISPFCNTHRARRRIPKGVAVSHANLLANLEMIRLSLGNTSQSTYVNWVPLYHDMGLILNTLEALYVGALCVLMAPQRLHPAAAGLAARHQRLSRRSRLQPEFRLRSLRQPLSRGADAGRRSLRMEDRAQRRRTGSCAKRSNGSSRPLPVTASIPDAAFPAYGMAEATLLISGGRRGAGHVTRMVSRSALASPQGRRTGAIPTTSRRWSAAGTRLSMSGSPSSIPDGCTRLRARPGRRSLGERSQRGAHLLEESGRDADRPERANRWRQ